MENRKFITNPSHCLIRELQNQNLLVQAARENPRGAFLVATQEQVLTPRGREHMEPKKGRHRPRCNWNPRRMASWEK